jgi:hypothetical protein
MFAGCETVWIETGEGVQAEESAGETVFLSQYEILK